jgi:hypothetical protein
MSSSQDQSSPKNHGGKRSGAGRPRKWDFWFVIEVGQACETLHRQAQDAAFSDRLDRLISEQTELKRLWLKAKEKPVRLRRQWLQTRGDSQLEEGYEQHLNDVTEEIKEMNKNNKDKKPTSRLVTLRNTPPKGTRNQIIAKVAEKFSLAPKQVDNIWQAYRRFELEK